MKRKVPDDASFESSKNSCPASIVQLDALQLNPSESYILGVPNGKVCLPFDKFSFENCY